MPLSNSEVAKNLSDENDNKQYSKGGTKAKTHKSRASNQNMIESGTDPYDFDKAAKIAAQRESTSTMQLQTEEGAK